MTFDFVEFKLREPCYLYQVAYIYSRVVNNRCTMAGLTISCRLSPGCLSIYTLIQQHWFYRCILQPHTCSNLYLTTKIIHNQSTFRSVHMSHLLCLYIICLNCCGIVLLCRPSISTPCKYYQADGKSICSSLVI